MTLLSLFMFGIGCSSLLLFFFTFGEKINILSILSISIHISSSLVFEKTICLIL